MSHQWFRKRGLANPIPAVEPGGVEQNEWDPGGDILLPDDHFSRLHNPANGRVPPQLPAAITRPKYPEFPLSQYERFFVTTPNNLDRSLGFQAQSVRVDNYSSHWIFFPSAGIYVPPFIYGAILQMSPAVSVAQFAIQPPTGYSDPTPVLDSNVITLWLEDVMVNSPGVPIQSSFRQGASGGAVVTGPLSVQVFGQSSSVIYVDQVRANNALAFGGGTTVQWEVHPAGAILALADNSFDIGASGANRPRNVYVANNVIVGANVLATGALQGGYVQIAGASAIVSGVGVPSAGTASNGDFYLRQDGAAGTAIYQKRAGAWVGIV